MQNQYQKTIYACFVAYIVQAIVNNFVPLLFLTFQNSYGIPLSRITMLGTINFGLQLMVDLVSVGFVDRIGYRASMVLAHALSAAGLVLLAVLPELLPSPFLGILLAAGLMMLCAGASEQGVSQWASTFAEKGLGVSKTVGDLAGPMTFAVPMGTSRAVGKYGQKLDLDRFMAGSALLCAAAYLCAALAPGPAMGLLGCAVCGLSVGIMWPGTFLIQDSTAQRAALHDSLSGRRFLPAGASCRIQEDFSVPREERG